MAHYKHSFVTLVVFQLVSYFNVKQFFVKASFLVGLLGAFSFLFQDILCSTATVKSGHFLSAYGEVMLTDHLIW